MSAANILAGVLIGPQVASLVPAHILSHTWALSAT